MDFEFFERSVLTYDQASFGLQRLVAAGLIRAVASPEGGLWLEPTETAIELRSAIEGNEPGARTLTQRLAEAIAERGGNPSRVGDPRRLPNLDEEAFELAVSPQQAWREKVTPEVEKRLLPGLTSRDIDRR